MHLVGNNKVVYRHHFQNYLDDKSVLQEELCSGIFPDNLKVARISPIYKDGDKKERGNYRPISVLSTVAKLFEKLVCIQLIDYLSKYKLHSKPVSVRLPSEPLNNVVLSDSWLVNMDAGLVNGVLFLDLRKAFDTVDHEILIKKLKIFRVQNTALKWFISYLFDRKQLQGRKCSIVNKRYTLWSSTGSKSRSIVISLVCQRSPELSKTL